jgi:hypothetical protein
MIGRYNRPSRNSRRSFIFVPDLPAIHIRGLAHGVECLTLGRVSILGFDLWHDDGNKLYSNIFNNSEGSGISLLFLVASTNF